MREEAVGMLNCKPGKIYVDGTLGGCGHAGLILEKILPGGMLIGIDQDMDAIQHAKEVLDPFKDHIHLVHDNFVNLKEILAQLDIHAVDGILLDLGLSYNQIENSGRGFSFMRDEPLDMRMNIASETTAEDIVNRFDEKALAVLFRKNSDERWARPIARKIVKERNRGLIRSSKQLADIVCSVVPQKRKRGRHIHPATKVFMALRIAVNRELEVLKTFLETVIEVMNTGGRLCILSFHSLEDRMVKHSFKRLEKGCICPPDFPECNCGRTKLVRVLTRKALKPSNREITENPLSRNTRLRAVEKI
jgi:16S rRNA (cytosine1402-N4)-methyltransferase